MRRKQVPETGPTNKETKALKQEYPKGTIIEFVDSDWAQRTGLVVDHASGLLVVRSPAKAAKQPRKTWGATQVFPGKHRIQRKQILYVLTSRGRRKSPVENA